MRQRAETRIGERHGRLVILSVYTNESGKSRAVCYCDCGNQHEAQIGNLTSGVVKSCGCLQVEARARGEHGHARKGKASPTYRCWTSMIRRCRYPTDVHWARYGGRGITVCDRWKLFADFLADMGERPSTQHSIDRIDNDGNYEPGNCRWADKSEQARNTRANVWITFGGLRETQAEWARLLGVVPTGLCRRLKTQSFHDIFYSIVYRAHKKPPGRPKREQNTIGI